MMVFAINHMISVSDAPRGPVWFCLKSQPKHEQIAATHLRRMIDGIEVFCPRLRIQRRTRRGAVWFVEAMFPGYLFARFDADQTMRFVQSVPGIQAVVRFGVMIPTIRDEVIAALRADFDHEETLEVRDEIQPGDAIVISAGPFQGLNAQVLRVLAPAGRVQVLLEVLGRSLPVNLARDQVSTDKSTAQLLRAAPGGPRA